MNFLHLSRPEKDTRTAIQYIMTTVLLQFQRLNCRLYTAKKCDPFLLPEKNANAANIVNGVGTLAKAKHLLHVQDLDT